jgi:NAD(P)-dependent dehydrogenase (short-subunit alcohol dehydrogenase family)
MSQNPTQAQPTPPFPEQEQEPPGRESEMRPLADHGQYASTKGAISTFTKGVAQEVAERGIRVNAVAPGPIWTPLVVMSFPGDKSAQFGADAPLGRPGQPGEPAPRYVFLATEDSRYIGGEVIGATGGKPLH